MKKILLITFLFYFHNAKAQDFAAQNQEILKEIEEVLLFENSEKYQINAITNAKNKDEFVIDKNNGENKIDFTVEKSKNIVDLDLKTKEKLAYNAYQNLQFEISIELYKQIIEKDANNEYALYSLAIIYQQMNQFSEAKKIYKKLLENGAKNYYEIIGNLMMIVSNESPRDGLYFLLRLSRQNPQSSYLLAQTGLCYAKINDYKNAINFLEKSVQKDKTRLDFQYNLAIIYDKDKNYEKALENYYEVLKNYYEDEEKWSNVIAINAIKSRIETLKSNI